ncbi:hypothetical protein VNO78_20179 [Psophocarpus tetragonolobus]|uniref:Pentatricopeptide repeat-containing protein n=1 Tax=Psophocarpus tetragonolobus TaxID=3891 RepID=A0AAN9SCW2_PSOTE
MYAELHFPSTYTSHSLTNTILQRFTFQLLWGEFVNFFTDDRSVRSKQLVGDWDDDFFRQQSDSIFKDNGSNQTQERFPLLLPRFDDNLRGPDEMDKNKSSQIDLTFQGNVAEKKRGVGLSGDSFLDKFKLGFDDKTVNSSEDANGKQSEEAKKMKETGLIPNAVAMLDGLCKDGHSPNVTTFVGLVDGFCKEKGVEEAKSAIKTLTEKGFAFDEKSVRHFLDKKTPFSSSVWEVIFGKKAPQRPC